MRYRILLVEDDPRLREIITDYCTAASNQELEVISAATGLEGVERFEETPVDLVLLDVMLPELDGFQVCRAIRRTSQVPVVFITARGEEGDKLNGYELGGDDYIVKPFLLSELLAKIRVLLRRSKGIGTDHTLTLGGIRLTTDTRQVTVNGDVVKFTRREYDLLRCLMEHPGRPLSRGQLLELVWGEDYQGFDRSVDNHVLKIRHKLGSEAKYLVTVSGFGYQMGGNGE